MRGQRDYLAARVLELEQEAEEAGKERAELVSKLEGAGGGGGGWRPGDANKLKIRVLPKTSLVRFNSPNRSGSATSLSQYLRFKSWRLTDPQTVRAVI